MSIYWTAEELNRIKECKENGNDDVPEMLNEESDTIIKSSPKIGRNDPCPCGSGKKYKKCCLN